MKFSVDRDVLADAVAWVARALPARPVVPVLSGLRLEAGDGLLALSCFDYELSASARMAADVAEPGAALVPGRLLAEIVRSLPGRPAQFSSQGDAVDLACGSAEFSLVSLPLAEYPSLPPAPPVAGTVDGGDLAAAAAQVLPAASRDDTLPMLTAVCLDIHGEVMTLAATDRYRMAVRDVRWSPADPGMRAVALVPARTLADAARAMAAGVPVAVSFEGEPAPGADPRPAEGMIAFESGGRRLTGRLIGGEFIRYESRFPAAFGCSAEIPAASLTEAVRRVSLVADRASPVQLTFGGGRVVVEAHAEGRARAVETVTASFRGEEPSIAFNPQYLLDGLVAAAASAPARHGGAAHGAPQAAGEGGGAQPAASPAAQPAIRLEFTTPAKPALITWAGEPDPFHGRSPDPSGQTGQDGGAGQDGGEPAGAAQAGAARPSRRPEFRYLVVPLRSPARG